MKRKLIKIIIVILIILITKELFIIIYINETNKKEIKRFNNPKYKYEYVDKLILEIPKINIKQMVDKADDNYSNLDKGLVYYKNNDYNKKIIIFGHSGIGYGVHFNRLDELDIEDRVYLYKNNYKITYIVSDIFTIREDEIGILDSENKPILMLITCKKNDKKKRLVVKLSSKSVKTLKK